MKQFKATRAHPDSRAIHALRTATRHVEALVILIAEIQRIPARHKIDRALRQPFDACGRVRDLQLMSRTVRGCKNQYPEVTVLLRYLDRRLSRRRRQLSRQLATAHPRGIKQTLCGVAAAIENSPSRSLRRSRGADPLVRGLEKTRRAALTTLRKTIVADPHSLHRTRLALKSYRYQAELLRRAQPVTAAPNLRQLRRIQRSLGAITDRSTLLHTLGVFGRTHPRAARNLSRYRIRIERQRQKLIARHFDELLLHKQMP